MMTCSISHPAQRNGTIFYLTQRTCSFLSVSVDEHACPIVRMQMQTSLGIVAMHIISSEEGTVTDVAVAVNGVFLLLQRGQSLK